MTRHLMRAFTSAAVGLCLCLGSASAQEADAQTLADIRQDLVVMHMETQRLKRELSTTGNSSVSLGGDNALARIGSIEGELQRLTGKIEELEFRIDSIVKDGTNRIGDLEFRLVELEGGDTSKLGQTSTLGGGAAPVVATPDQPAGTDAGGTQLAMGEQADFDAARSALDAGDAASAAELFGVFTSNYPGSPLEGEARLMQGQAFEQAGNPREAARAYLEAYSGDPSGVQASQALFRLGRALGRLGKLSEACVTLGEVPVRHPGSTAATEAQSEMNALNCP